MLLIQIKHTLGLELIYIHIDNFLENQIVHSARMRDVFHFVQENKEGVRCQFVVRVV